MDPSFWFETTWDGPFNILGVSGYKFQTYFVLSSDILNITNSVDPDEFHLDLHC